MLHLSCTFLQPVRLVGIGRHANDAAEYPREMTTVCEGDSLCHVGQRNAGQEQKFGFLQSNLHLVRMRRQTALLTKRAPEMKKTQIRGGSQFGRAYGRRNVDYEIVSGLIEPVSSVSPAGPGG
jgi:hypothetical protein